MNKKIEINSFKNTNTNIIISPLSYKKLKEFYENGVKNNEEKNNTDDRNLEILQNIAKSLVVCLNLDENGQTSGAELVIIGPNGEPISTKLDIWNEINDIKGSTGSGNTGGSSNTPGDSDGDDNPENPPVTSGLTNIKDISDKISNIENILNTEFVIEVDKVKSEENNEIVEEVAIPENLYGNIIELLNQDTIKDISKNLKVYVKSEKSIAVPIGVSLRQEDDNILINYFEVNESENEKFIGSKTITISPDPEEVPTISDENLINEIKDSIKNDTNTLTRDDVEGIDEEDESDKILLSKKEIENRFEALNEELNERVYFKFEPDVVKDDPEDSGENEGDDEDSDDTIQDSSKFIYHIETVLSSACDEDHEDDPDAECYDYFTTIDLGDYTLKNKSDDRIGNRYYNFYTYKGEEKVALAKNVKFEFTSDEDVAIITNDPLVKYNKKDNQIYIGSHENFAGSYIEIQETILGRLKEEYLPIKAFTTDNAKDLTKEIIEDNYLPNWLNDGETIKEGVKIDNKPFDNTVWEAIYEKIGADAEKIDISNSEEDKNAVYKYTVVGEFEFTENDYYRIRVNKSSAKYEEPKEEEENEDELLGAGLEDDVENSTEIVSCSFICKKTNDEGLLALNLMSETENDTVDVKYLRNNYKFIDSNTPIGILIQKDSFTIYANSQQYNLDQTDISIEHKTFSKLKVSYIDQEELNKKIEEQIESYDDGSLIDILNEKRVVLEYENFEPVSETDIREIIKTHILSVVKTEEDEIEKLDDVEEDEPKDEEQEEIRVIFNHTNISVFNKTDNDNTYFNFITGTVNNDRVEMIFEHPNADKNGYYRISFDIEVDEKDAIQIKDKVVEDNKNEDTSSIFKLEFIQSTNIVTNWAADENSVGFIDNKPFGDDLPIDPIKFYINENKEEKVYASKAENVVDYYIYKLEKTDTTIFDFVDNNEYRFAVGSSYNSGKLGYESASYVVQSIADEKDETKRINTYYTVKSLGGITVKISAKSNNGEIIDDINDPDLNKDQLEYRTEWPTCTLNKDAQYGLVLDHQKNLTLYSRNKLDGQVVTIEKYGLKRIDTKYIPKDASDIVYNLYIKGSILDDSEDNLLEIEKLYRRLITQRESISLNQIHLHNSRKYVYQLDDYQVPTQIVVNESSDESNAEIILTYDNCSIRIYSEQVVEEGEDGSIINVTAAYKTEVIPENQTLILNCVESEGKVEAKDSDELFEEYLYNLCKYHQKGNKVILHVVTENKNEEDKKSEEDEVKIISEYKEYKCIELNKISNDGKIDFELIFKKDIDDESVRLQNNDNKIQYINEFYSVKIKEPDPKDENDEESEEVERESKLSINIIQKNLIHADWNATEEKSGYILNKPFGDNMWDYFDELKLDVDGKNIKSALNLYIREEGELKEVSSVIISHEYAFVLQASVAPGRRYLAYFLDDADEVVYGPYEYICENADGQENLLGLEKLNETSYVISNGEAGFSVDNGTNTVEIYSTYALTGEGPKEAKKVIFYERGIKKMDPIYLPIMFYDLKFVNPQRENKEDSTDEYSAGYFINPRPEVVKACRKMYDPSIFRLLITTGDITKYRIYYPLSVNPFYSENTIEIIYSIPLKYGNYFKQKKEPGGTGTVDPPPGPIESLENQVLGASISGLGDSSLKSQQAHNMGMLGSTLSQYDPTINPDPPRPNGGGTGADTQYIYYIIIDTVSQAINLWQKIAEHPSTDELKITYKVGNEWRTHYLYAAAFNDIELKTNEDLSNVDIFKEKGENGNITVNRITYDKADDVSSIGSTLKMKKGNYFSFFFYSDDKFNDTDKIFTDFEITLEGKKINDDNTSTPISKVLLKYDSNAEIGKADTNKARYFGWFDADSTHKYKIIDGYGLEDAIFNGGIFSEFPNITELDKVKAGNDIIQFEDEEESPEIGPDIVNDPEKPNGWDTATYLYGVYINKLYGEVRMRKIEYRNLIVNGNDSEEDSKDD